MQAKTDKLHLGVLWIIRGIPEIGSKDPRSQGGQNRSRGSVWPIDLCDRVAHR